MVSATSESLPQANRLCFSPETKPLGASRDHPDPYNPPPACDCKHNACKWLGSNRRIRMPEKRLHHAHSLSQCVRVFSFVCVSYNNDHATIRLRITCPVFNDRVSGRPNSEIITGPIHNTRVPSMILRSMMDHASSDSSLRC